VNAGSSTEPHRNVGSVTVRPVGYKPGARLIRRSASRRNTDPRPKPSSRPLAVAFHHATSAADRARKGKFLTMVRIKTHVR
jgi:hypothetical protein